MSKTKHPKSRFERLLSAQKKEHARQAKADKADRVRARLARETLTIKELEDAVSSGEDR